MNLGALKLKLVPTIDYILYTVCTACMCSHPILCTAVYISTGCQPAHGQLNRENEYLLFPCLRSRLRIRSRKTASAVLSRVSLIILHTQAECHPCCTTRNRVSPEFIGSRISARGGGAGRAARLIFVCFFPCSADHERDWPPCKVVFFGLATNALNVRNNNKQLSL